MKVLLDEDLPHALRLHLPTHDVRTVQYMGWNGLKNGVLLQTAEADGMEVFVTGDKNIIYQQNTKVLKLGVVVLGSPDWPVIKLHLPEIAVAVDVAVAGVVQYVNFT